MSRRKPRRAQQPNQTRRASAAQIAQGQPLPSALVHAPHLFMGTGRRTRQDDQVNPNAGQMPDKILQAMYAHQAPQATFGGVLAPGAPLRPIAGIETYDGPRQWEFPLGVNVNLAPRSTERYSFSQLRRLAQLYYGIQLAEGVWFDVLSRLVPKITMRPGVIPDGEADDDPKWAKILQPARDFFRRPDGQQRLGGWLTASARDTLELGLSLIWKRRDKAGRLVGLDVLDPALWKILVDQRGRLPVTPYPAYLQVVNGIAAGLYPTDNLIQIQENGRSDSIYPLSRVEKIIFTVQQALRHQDLNYARYTDGSVPEGMLFVDDAGGNSDPLDPKWEMVERALNGQLAGNDVLRSRIKVIPPGLGGWVETRPDDPQTAYDRWLLNLVAGMFGVTMDEIGITDTSNRSVGASQENVIYRRVVRPVAHTYAEVLTEIAQELCDDARVIFEWMGIDEPEDELKKAQVLAIGVEKAAISPSDMAHMMKWPVKEEVQPFMNTQMGLSGVVTLDMIAQAAAFAAAGQKADQAQKAAALQQQQLINQQMQRQQEQQDQMPDFGDEEPPEEGGQDTSDQEPPPANEPPALTGGAAAKPQVDETQESGNPDAAPAQVDALIQQAKQGKGQAQRAQAADDPAAMKAEWRAWREKALRAAKAGQPQPAWQQAALPAKLVAYAQERLQGVVMPDAVRAVFAEVQAVEQGEEERIFGFGGGGHQAGKTQEVHGPGGRIIGNVSLVEHGIDGRLGTGTTGSVPTHDRGHGAAVTVAGGATYHTSGQQYYESAATRALLQDYFGRDLADHEIASLVGAQPGMQVSVEYGQHRDAPALEFVVTGRVAQNPTAYSAHRLLFREADGTLTMGNAASHLAMGRGHGLGLHIFKDQVAALRHFNVARITTSANGNHNTLARGGTSGFYTWARFGFNGPIDWKYIHSELRALKLPPPGRAFLQARTTNDLMRLPGGAAEWKRVGQAFSGEFSLTPGSDALRLLDGYLQEKGVAWESTLEATALPFNHAWEQRAAQADALGDTVMPELTPVDEAILDRVWAALAAHTHHFVEQRCMVCGCGEPASDHGMPYPVRLPDEAASTFSPPWLTLYLPARLSQQLAVSGGEDVLDLHITLACLTGDATDWADPARFDRLRDMAQQWAATHDPQVIRISGVGRFTGDDTSYPLYASVDSLTIQAWRADLVQALDAAGFAVDTTYGYTPHITLAYLPQGTPPPDIQVPDVTATLDHLWCCVGDRRYAYPLGPAAQVDRAALVVDVARQLKADLLRDLEI